MHYFLLLHIYVILLLFFFFLDAFCPKFRGFFCHLSQFFGREMHVEYTEKFTYPYKGRIIFFFNFKYVFVLMPASLHRVEIGSWLACRKYSSIIPIRESGCWVLMSVSFLFCIIFLRGIFLSWRENPVLWHILSLRSIQASDLRGLSENLK